MGQKITIEMDVDEARRFFAQMPPLFGVDDIAKQYGLNAQYVRDAIKSGMLKAVMIAKCWKSSAADVSDWIDRMAKTQEAEKQS